MAPPPVDDDFASLRNNARDKEFEDLKVRCLPAVSTFLSLFALVSCFSLLPVFVLVIQMLLQRRVAQLEADLARERAEKELMRREMEALRYVRFPSLALATNSCVFCVAVVTASCQPLRIYAH
jgi:hypothetical protein